MRKKTLFAAAVMSGMAAQAAPPARVFAPEMRMGMRRSHRLAGIPSPITA